MRVILMHGKDTNPSGKWYPWLAAEMRKRDIEYLAPFLPDAADPVMEDWLAELDRASPDEEAVLVGHSRGGVAILRWLEKQPEGSKVRKVILLGTNSGFADKIAIPSETNYGFYTEEGYDFAEIKKHCDNFVVMHSKDDPWVPFEAGEENARGLDAKFLQFEDHQHFGKRVKQIPELIEEIVS